MHNYIDVPWHDGFQGSCHSAPWVWAPSSTPRTPTSPQCTSTIDISRLRKKTVRVSVSHCVARVGVFESQCQLSHCAKEWWPLSDCVSKAPNSGGLVEARTWLLCMSVTKTQQSSTELWKGLVTSTIPSITQTSRNGMTSLFIGKVCACLVMCVGEGVWSVLGVSSTVGEW